MSVEPVIAFGQQPCGFFPRRFLVAKIQTARRLQAEMGGRIVFFYHDSDHDPRETRTILRHRTTGESASLNFAVANKLQRKFSPLYVKRIAPDWHGKTVLQLPNYVEGGLIDLFRQTSAQTVADFCLEMYRRMGLLDDIEAGIARSYGTCMTMGTASTMTSLTEVLGFSLPGASSIPAVDSNHVKMANRSGRRIVEMVWEDSKPRDFLTSKSVDNAITTSPTSSAGVRPTRSISVPITSTSAYIPNTCAPMIGKTECWLWW